MIEEVDSADSQQLLARASDLMFEALILLDRAQTAHAAALLDHAIALLPVCALSAPVRDITPKTPIA